MIIDLLENAPDDYVVDKEWIEAELREIFQMFYHIGWEKYADGKPC
jgi:Leu/Phe-tRNA-protein transferase